MAAEGVPRAPEGLSARAAQLWRDVLEDYELSAAEVVLLHEGLTALDRAAEAAEVVAAEGVTVTDRYGTPKAHPACDVESRNRGLFAAILRQLAVKVPESPRGRSGPMPQVAKFREAS